MADFCSKAGVIGALAGEPGGARDPEALEWLAVQYPDFQHVEPARARIVVTNVAILRGR